MKKFLFRVDGGVRMGWSHWMRSLALAQAWRDHGGNSFFAAVDPELALQASLDPEMDLAEIKAEPGSPGDLRQTADLAKKLRAEWIILDGRQFDGEYQKKLKSSGFRLLVIDDFGSARHYCGDLVLNPNVFAEPAMYGAREQHTRLLLGSRFALLRRPFWKWRDWERQTLETARNVLVMVDSADAAVMLQILDALQQIRQGCEIQFIARNGNTEIETLCEAVKVSKVPAAVKRNISKITESMVWADLAITSAGTDCLDLAFMQVPMLTIVLEENQEAAAESLETAGAARNAGWHYALNEFRLAEAVERMADDRTAREEMSANGRRLVDGGGADRVLEEMGKR